MVAKRPIADAASPALDAADPRLGIATPDDGRRWSARLTAWLGDECSSTDAAVARTRRWTPPTGTRASAAGRRVFAHRRVSSATLDDGCRRSVFESRRTHRPVPAVGERASRNSSASLSRWRASPSRRRARSCRLTTQFQPLAPELQPSASEFQPWASGERLTGARLRRAQCPTFAAGPIASAAVNRASAVADRPWTHRHADHAPNGARADPAVRWASA